MPELPEVETIVRELNKTIPGREIEDVWTDFKKMVKKPAGFDKFKEGVRGRKIEKVWRRGKNILFDLSGNRVLLVHQKLTGHLLLGNWTPTLPPSSQASLGPQLAIGNWIPLTKGPLEEPVNRFIHLMFWLDDGRMLALSDLRKFAKVELLDRKEIKQEISSLGPEPLEKSFTLEDFKERLKIKNGKIKQILMDQEVIAGIGNIYSDEILWQAQIHPFKDISKLKQSEIRKIYRLMRKILARAIELKGESISDFRRLSGEKGYFDKERKVYQREGEICSRCGTIIKRVKLGGRSAHFCPQCQPLT